jgi:hypothetical protein
MGMRWKSVCADSSAEVMRYVEQDYPQFVALDSKYWVFYHPEFVQFNGSDNRFVYAIRYKEVGSMSPATNSSIVVYLNPCESDEGIFSGLPLQDVFIWFALGFVFLFGFHSGRR